jgi:large subunit ribosomal protein L2
MALKTFRPTTPSLRQLVQVDRGHLYKGAPIKVLTEGKTKSGGRNNYGRITTRHIGGGHKQAYRKVDFKRGKLDIPANVERLEYDPNRTAFIALLKYNDGTLGYILAPQRLAVGDTVVSGIKADVKPGNAMQLASMPVGTIVHNIELKAGGGGKIARSAGAYGQLVGRDAGWAILRLNSGETRRVRAECMATVGAVSNPDHMNESTGKAGRTRWRGTRPTVRSIAMNPIDHPNGGRTKGGKHWATPWGKPTKGYKTRKNKATDRFIVSRRRRPCARPGATRSSGSGAGAPPSCRSSWG